LLECYDRLFWAHGLVLCLFSRDLDLRLPSTVLLVALSAYPFEDVEQETKRSRRTDRLTRRAVEALRGHRARQAKEKLRVGGLYQEQDLVFAGEGGGFINPSNLRQRSLAPLLKRAGLPQITFHDLRHTCASLLFQKNVHPKFVQELLGHASVAITLDTYSHMLPGMGGEAADAMGEALG
jgi:integrase